MHTNNAQKSYTLTKDQFTSLTQKIRDDDRVGFYIELYELTGAKTVLNNWGRATVPNSVAVRVKTASVFTASPICANTRCHLPLR